MNVTPTITVDSADKTFFGHPRMLANLFSVELWERFSFYGMQAILLTTCIFRLPRVALLSTGPSPRD